MIRVYAGESEEYFAFITPECWSAIEEYRESWEKETGKPPKPTDPFFKTRGVVIKPLSEIGLRTRLVTLLEECNLRRPLPKGKRRHDVPPFKGFRYFFDKRSKRGFSNNAVLA